MKVFLAGLLEWNRGRALLEKHKPLYVLDAYKYNKKLPDYNIYDYVEDFLLDSGAFTVINAARQDKKVQQYDWYDYARKYANYVKTLGIKNYFELDIDCVLGYDEVLKLRKVIESIVGWQSIPVWHPNRGLEDFTKTCKNYKYIALGSFGKTGANKDRYMKFFIDEAHRNGTRIHGLGYTKTFILDKINFDTVDSTSWLNGQKFGNLVIFDGRKIKNINNGQMYRKDGKIVNQNLAEHNLKEWIKFQKYAKDNL